MKVKKFIGVIVALLFSMTGQSFDGNKNIKQYNIEVSKEGENLVLSAQFKDADSKTPSLFDIMNKILEEKIGTSFYRIPWSPSVSWVGSVSLLTLIVKKLFYPYVEVNTVPKQEVTYPDFFNAEEIIKLGLTLDKWSEIIKDKIEKEWTLAKDAV